MTLSRPHDLAEVARRAREGEDTFGRALAEFLDAFYLDDTLDGRRYRLARQPQPTGNPLDDAWLGAVGEHLSQRWELGQTPAWVNITPFDCAPEPSFYPSTPKLRGKLLVESPPAFRRRLLFTNAEPLMRARFPRHLKAVMPFPTERENTEVPKAPKPM